MAKRMAVTRVVGVIGAAIGLGAPHGTHARADDPRPEAAAPKTVAEAREIVRELEAQAEAQRAQLKQTEATLERARALLRGLEDGAVVEKLKAREEQLAQRIAQHQKLGRSPNDPSLNFMQRMLDRTREEIRDHERSHGPRP